MKIRALLASLMALFAVSCGVEMEMEVPPSDEVMERMDAVTTEVKRARSDLVKAHASARGLTNAVLVAGVANHETGMTQCWSEATHHCPGPASSDCGGGPVLAGSGDGPCPDRAGGLGMFQFDSGNYDQTLASYGTGILTVSGNAKQGVDTVIAKVRACPNTPVFNSDAEAIAWMNTAKVGTTAYETFITAMAWCYNGCSPSMACHAQRRADYKAGIESLLSLFGEAYWYSGDGMRSTPQRVAKDAEGRITLVARNSGGAVSFKRQASAGSSSWSGWTSLGGVLVEDPVVARNANGRLTVLGIGTDRALYINHQSSSTTWTGWLRVGGSFGSHVAVGVNKDGRLEAFGRGTDNALWRSHQTAVNSSTWAAPVSLGGVLTSDPAVARDLNGWLNVFLVGSSGRFFRIQQSSTGWTGFIEMTGVVATSAPSVNANWDGRLEVFVRRNDNALVHAWHTTTSATAWSTWSSRGGVITAAPVAARNANNRIEVFVKNDRNGVHRVWQHSTTGWTSWVEMGGVVQGAPAVVNNSANNLEIYVVGGEGHYRQVQLQVDGNWSNTWELLGRP
jgi:hypothetical protein